MRVEVFQINTIKQIQENPNYINRHILTYDEMASAKPGNSQEPLVNVRKYFGARYSS